MMPCENRECPVDGWSKQKTNNCGISFGGASMQEEMCKHYHTNKPEPPALEWDWDAPFMWGSYRFDSENIMLFEKLGLISYAEHDKYKKVNLPVSKQHILNEYNPTTKPDNCKDYGLTEDDLK